MVKCGVKRLAEMHMRSEPCTTKGDAHDVNAHAKEYAVVWEFCTMLVMEASRAERVVGLPCLSSKLPRLRFRNAELSVTEGRHCR